MSALISGFPENSGKKVHWEYNDGSKNPPSGVLQSGTENIPNLEQKGDYWKFTAKKDSGNNEPSNLRLIDFVPHHNIEIKYNKKTHIWKIKAGAPIPAGKRIKAEEVSTVGVPLPTQTYVNVEIGPK